MSKMTVIQLLNKIANGEKIKAKYRLFDLEYNNLKEFHISYDEIIDTFTLGDLIRILNDEVEIIEEEKKILEKIDNNYFLELNDTAEILELYEKQCEIIDYLKSKGE